MNQEIHSHLEKLKLELNKLEPAVKHLQKADENANALVSSLSNIHKEFAKHLQNIEKSLADANEKHQNQLSKEIQEATIKLKDVGKGIGSSFYKAETSIKDLLEEYSLLSSETGKLVEMIDKINFPSRLDKLDVSISSINIELQKLDMTLSSLNNNLVNSQQKTNEMETNLKNDIDTKTKVISSKIDSTDGFVTQVFDSVNQLEKQNRMLRFTVILITIISIAILVMQIRRFKW